MQKKRYDSSRRVLVVGHDEILSNSIARALDEQGCAAVVALDGFEAQKMLEGDWYFVGIIIDSRIRNPPSPTLVRHIKSQKALKSIPVIIVSASWTSEESNESLTAGAIALVPMGFTETQLQSVIATVIGMKTKSVWE